jgi:5-formyltetrahydrofolate cyclo-ligase
VATKAELRRMLEEKRQALSPEEVEAASRAVLEQLQRVVDWPTVTSVHVYSSVPEWGELDTSALVDWLQDEWQIEIVQPSLLKEQPFPEQLFDVIIVPALGFDRDNNRLGFGGGWYDRFVAQQLQAQKIGVAYAWALVEDGIPVDPWDMKLDLVVTG